MHKISHSGNLENCIDNVQQREIIHSIHSNLLSGLKEIKHVIDGDMRGKAFAISRWVVKFRKDVRNLRSIYEQNWDSNVENLSLERLQRMKDITEDELIGSDFYIENIHDTDSLVEHIHQLQRKCCGEELDKFLYNYALLEFLEERIENMEPSKQNVTIVNVDKLINNGDFYNYN